MYSAWLAECKTISLPEAYGFTIDALAFFIFEKNRKQTVRVNNTNSNFKSIISGVPVGSIIGPIVFKLTINALFYFIITTSVYNFTDDNTLLAFAKTISELISTLEREFLNIVDCLMLTKNSKSRQLSSVNYWYKRQDNANRQISTVAQNIKAVSSVKLLGVETDDKLHFNQHVSNILNLWPINWVQW